ncbi:MMS19 nucleotide excision repair protein homolog isoform X2 [Mercurialis annua]|uniref:MMS19 nucleotide excision repair protein homolog isoform X2 n=1 Tax=Mercurialis annua TaxID=3986 RepID=UPI0021606664|nr:MMS19 nucleotide excision repair protein homolog isoform X2 [Mercurialis annua]
MAESTQLSQHIESYVDSTRSLTQQAASLDAIVLLLKNDAVTVESLVKVLEMYLTTTDDIIRARGILLLGEALTRLSSKPLDTATTRSLIRFFTERLADWRALRGALVGCLALIKKKSNGITGNDAKSIAECFFKVLQVQSLAQHDRKLCFELLECVLEQYPDTVNSLGEDLIYGICEAIDGEKDPQCLMLTFHIVEMLGKLFLDPCGPISNFVGDLFAILGCYFPIHFTHPNSEDIDVKRDDLSRALMLAFSSTPLFEPFAMPLLLEKLSSSLPSAKVDSLKYLGYCTLKFGVDRTAKHARAIWSLLKDEICSSGEEYMVSSDAASIIDPDSHKNEVATEALSLLEKLIVQNGDLFLSMIISDEDVNMVFKTISSFKSYNLLSPQSKQKLHMVGRVVCVCAKTSVSSCNTVFKKFFLDLMEALDISVENTSRNFQSNGKVSKAGQFDYGSSYLCIKLLGACRDLTASSENLASECLSSNETWCRLLQHYSTSLTETFSSVLASCTKGPTRNVDIYLGVKGLQILATFPGGSSLISKLTFDNILMKLLSIINMNFNKTLLWNQALNALVQIGSFVHGCNESDRQTSYMDIIVGKMILLASAADFNMPWRLKQTAISSIATSGQKYLLKFFLELEEAIHSNLADVYVKGNVESSNILLQLLECYSVELLPWIQKTEGFEENLMQFVVNLWNQIENCTTFSVACHEKDKLLESIMKVIKDAVACCSVESQNIIISKAYGVLSSSTSLPLKGSMPDNPVQLERFKDNQEMHSFSSRDEWILSLFASVIIALRPKTQIPNTRTVLNLFIMALLKGHVTAAQALGSMVNKLDVKSNGASFSDGCTVDDAMAIIHSTNLFYSFDNGSFAKSAWTSNGDEMALTNLCFDAPNLALLQIPAIVGLAWIGKGLLMRGHEKIKDITMVFLNCLLSDGKTGTLLPENGSLENSRKQDLQQSVTKSAADAFQILMSDSELSLNRKYHAIVRPLYKQRFFSTIMPILHPLIIQSNSSFSRSMLYRAFAHVISDTPLSVIVNDAKKLIPMLLDALILLSKDVMDKDIMYGLLLVLSGILTDKNGKEAVIEHAHSVIKCLIELIPYPHMTLIRETSVQCLVAMSELPHTRIYPVRNQVLQAISKAVDDSKRVVRQEAVRCRKAWSMSNSFN